MVPGKLREMCSNMTPSAPYSYIHIINHLKSVPSHGDLGDDTDLSLDTTRTNRDTKIATTHFFVLIKHYDLRE